MAVVSNVTTTPATVPYGGSSSVAVWFTLQPGKTVDVVITEQGGEKGRGMVQFDGETLPAVKVGATGQGWEIRATAGTLTEIGANTFKLVA